WPGSAPRAELDGMRVFRTGGRHSFALRGRPLVRERLRAERYDVVVEDINKLPLFLTGMTRLPFLAIIPHLFGATAFREASWPVAAVVWAAERPLPWAYRRARFHAISDSTRDDLVTRGVSRERIEVVYPGVDAMWYRPDPAVARAVRPTFLYVGRLKRYKGVETALRALAEARRTRPEIALEIAGQGDDRARLEGVARRPGIRRNPVLGAHRDGHGGPALTPPRGGRVAACASRSPPATATWPRSCARGRACWSSGSPVSRAGRSTPRCSSPPTTGARS